MSSIPWSISEDSLDVNFSVPQILRLRITRDCFASDWDQVRSLFRSDSGPARIQVWVDKAVSDANPAMLVHLHQRLSESQGQIELVSPIQCIEGGEQAKNDENTVHHIFQTIDRDGLDRRSYVVVIGGTSSIYGGLAITTSHLIPTSASLTSL